MKRDLARIKMLEENTAENLKRYNKGEITKETFIIRDRDVRNRLAELRAPRKK